MYNRQHTTMYAKTELTVLIQLFCFAMLAMYSSLLVTMLM